MLVSDTSSLLYTFRDLMVNIVGGKASSVVSGLHYRLFYALYLYENSCVSNHSMLQETMANHTGQQSIIKYRYIFSYIHGSQFLCQIQVQSHLHTDPVSPAH